MLKAEELRMQFSVRNPLHVLVTLFIVEIKYLIRSEGDIAMSHSMVAGAWSSCLFTSPWWIRKQRGDRKPKVLPLSIPLSPTGLCLLMNNLPKRHGQLKNMCSNALVCEGRIITSSIHKTSSSVPETGSKLNTTALNKQQQKTTSVLRDLDYCREVNWVPQVLLRNKQYIFWIPL